jgi:hypothetical protein
LIEYLKEKELDHLDYFKQKQWYIITIYKLRYEEKDKYAEQYGELPEDDDYLHMINENEKEEIDLNGIRAKQDSLKKELKHKEQVAEGKYIRLQELQRQLEAMKESEKKQVPDLEKIIEKVEEAKPVDKTIEKIENKETITTNRSERSIKKNQTCQCQCLIF